MYTHLELAPREREVLIQLAKTGNSNKALAEELHLSYVTVENYISRIISKLGVENRTQAVIYAYCSGMIDKCEGFPSLQDSE